MGNYVLDNGWEHERVRLASLEGVFDPGTTRHLDAIGVGRGWNCLEVGGGGGSITAWLCRRVGEAGRVVATDIDTRFLDALDYPNLKVLRHDIVVDDVPEASFDLVHSRMLLEHLPERDKIVERLVASLKPGGVIMIEDADARSLFADPPIVVVHPEADTARVVDIWRALFEILGDAGFDHTFSARLSGALLAHGLEDVSTEGRCPMMRGGTSDVIVSRFTLEALRGQLVGSGRLSDDDIDWILGRLDDRDHREATMPVVAVWGRRPGAPSSEEPAPVMVSREDDLVDRLGTLPLFAGCSTDQLMQVASMASPVSTDRAQVVVEEGEPGDLFYVVLTGTATVRRGRRKLAKLGPGSFFGETALLTTGTRTATVTADTAMRLVAFDRDAFDQLLTDLPSTARAVLEGVAERTTGRPPIWP